LTATSGSRLTHALAAVFFAVSYYFVYRSFYGMRIRSGAGAEAAGRAAAD
jgi:K(+)-stimulated pyrophosphate-energized sodium pump